MFDLIDSHARPLGLTILGGFHPGPQDGLPGAGTLLLLGPDEPQFWPLFTAAPEYADGAPDPMDRWSARVIGALAAALPPALGAAPLFPFGGPPHPPFHRWALRSGRCFDAPIGMLVHDHAGLMVSFRGALAFPGRIALPGAPASASPCTACAARPCASACPAGAWSTPGFDPAACRAHLAAPEGAPCRDAGCLARRACPVSARFPRLPAQSAFHMQAFRKGLGA